MKRNIEVCFSPALFPLYKKSDVNVVVVDILRATSVICTMFKNGVEKVIPVKTIEEVKEASNKGHLIVAERDGKKLDFADLGNSPYYFTPDVVAGKTLVYSTTNGTNAITMGEECANVLIGSFLNIKAVVDFLINDDKDVVVLCAGWKNKYCIEDTIFAGAVVEALLENENFCTMCDSAVSSKDLWVEAEKDLMTYIDKAAQRHRLKKLGLDNVIEYCLSQNLTNVLPVFVNKELVNFNKK